MKAALFVPCYIDAFFPEVGIATLELLERLGVEVAYPLDQTCCGAADGQQRLPRRCGGDRGAVRQEFRRVRLHRRAVGKLRSPRARPPDGDPADAGRCTKVAAQHLRARRVPARRAQGPARSPGPSSRTRSACTTAARRCARCATAKMSEIDEPFFSKPLDLLSKVKGIEFVTPQRPDECCGFGGTFSVFEEPVSAEMGYDKVNDHHRAGAEYIVSADMSCIMHQKGCAERLGPADQVHPHRADPERSARGMKRIDHAEASSTVHQGQGPHRLPRQAAVGPAQEARPRKRAAPRMGGAALARLGDQGTHADPPRRLPRGIRAQRDRATARTCTGRGTPPSTTRSSSTS